MYIDIIIIKKINFDRVLSGFARDEVEIKLSHTQIRLAPAHPPNGAFDLDITVSGRYAYTRHRCVFRTILPSCMVIIILCNIIL